MQDAISRSDERMTDTWAVAVAKGDGLLTVLGNGTEKLLIQKKLDLVQNY